MEEIVAMRKMEAELKRRDLLFAPALEIRIVYPDNQDVNKLAITEGCRTEHFTITGFEKIKEKIRQYLEKTAYSHCTIDINEVYPGDYWVGLETFFNGGWPNVTVINGPSDFKKNLNP